MGLYFHPGAAPIPWPPVADWRTSPSAYGKGGGMATRVIPYRFCLRDNPPSHLPSTAGCHVIKNKNTKMGFNMAARCHMGNIHWIFGFN